MLLELTDVSKSYAGPEGAVHALSGVSLSVESGQFVAVRGPSGCGKSPLLLIAGGLLRPDRGTVRVAGENPYDLAADARAAFRARKIGYVFQQFHLVPYLSVLDNVLAPTLAMPSADPRRRALELIERFGLAHRAHHVPGELSSGERQRTALARALLNRPQLILADEPTGNLDRENAAAVLGFLSEFVTQEGCGVLLVTHDPLAAERADTTLHLRDGVQVEEPPAQ
jgi:putative ABC transport system ATP-binding protein